MVERGLVLKNAAHIAAGYREFGYSHEAARKAVQRALGRADLASVADDNGLRVRVTYQVGGGGHKESIAYTLADRVAGLEDELSAMLGSVRILEITGMPMPAADDPVDEEAALWSDVVRMVPNAPAISPPVPDTTKPRPWPGSDCPGRPPPPDFTAWSLAQLRWFHGAPSGDRVLGWDDPDGWDLLSPSDDNLPHQQPIGGD